MKYTIKRFTCDLLQSMSKKNGDSISSSKTNCAHENFSHANVRNLAFEHSYLNYRTLKSYWKSKQLSY